MQMMYRGDIYEITFVHKFVTYTSLHFSVAQSSVSSYSSIKLHRLETQTVGRTLFSWLARPGDSAILISQSQLEASRGNFGPTGIKEAASYRKNKPPLITS